MSDIDNAEKYGTYITIVIIALIFVFYFFTPSFNFLSDKETPKRNVLENKNNPTEGFEEEQEIYFDEDYSIDDGTEIFTIVEQMPVFKGCDGLSDDKLDQCTKKKIQEYSAQVDYPQIAIDNDIEGKVYISFVVGKYGYAREVTLLRGVDPLLDNAALDHIKNMPKFIKPGFQRGKPVKVKYNIPINFKLG